MVITCWNGEKLLRESLPKVVEASENPENRIKEVIVVDDASTDSSVEYVNKFKVRLVKHERNLGYSATCNTGVREARGELVVVLNLDVVPSLNFLESVLSHFDDEKVFAVSFNEGKFGPGKLGWKKGFLEIIPSEASSETSFSDWANGGSSIFRKRIWDELGGMDKLFLPFYFEDIDLGIRGRKAGFKCLWEPRAKVKHQHEATINKETFKVEYINLIKQRNHLLLTWRNLDNVDRFFTHVFYLSKRCLFHPGYSKIVFLALKRLVTDC